MLDFLSCEHHLADRAQAAPDLTAAWSERSGVWWLGLGLVSGKEGNNRLTSEKHSRDSGNLVVGLWRSLMCREELKLKIAVFVTFAGMQLFFDCSPSPKPSTTCCDIVAVIYKQ